MAGISSNALKGVNYPENRRKYNGNELQNKEFGDGAGLEWTDFNARTYDQQIGRFQQIDPWVEVGTQEILTPYQFGFNNPIRYNDPTGRCVPCLVWEAPTIVEGIVALGAATGITAVIYNAADKLRNVDWSELGAGSQTTFVPHITIPQSTVRKMQSEGTANSSQPATNQTSQSAAQTPGSPNSNNNSGNTGNQQESKQRNKPNQTGTPNSSSIDGKDASGKTTKYSTYDENGKLVKQVEGDRGEPRHGVPGATKKVPTINTLPDGTVKPGKFKILPATPQETPPGNNLRN